MAKHPVRWFYLLAFGISWLGWVPLALGSYGIHPLDRPYLQLLLILPGIGPALAAVLVTHIAYGKPSVRDLFTPFGHWRVGFGWYLVAVFGPFLLFAAGQGLTRWLGFTATTSSQGNLFSLTLSALVMSLLSNPWEEVGWRNFALPHLQRRYTALTATLIVGVLWGLWHLPLFFWRGHPLSQSPFLPWFISTVAVSFVYTWIYNGTRGSLLLVTLFHIAFNTFGAVFRGVSATSLGILSFLIAVALVASLGGEHLSRQERVRQV